MKIFSLFFLVLFSTSAFSQTPFQNISFNEALNQSQKTGKLILLQLESLDCEMCNYAVEQAFTNKELTKRIEEQFVAMKVDYKHDDRNFINGLYDLSNTSIGTLFIDGSRNLIHRFSKTTTMANAYFDEFSTVQFKNSEVIRLNIYADDYEKFKTNDHLERWIWARKNLNLNNDSLLNIYVKNIQADSINSERVLNFIIRQAPLLESAADRMTRNNSSFRKIWYEIPSSERVLINRRKVSKTLQKAILDKDERYAYSVAFFLRSTYSSNPAAGINNFNQQMMKYYLGVENMDKYMTFANLYFDTLLLKTTVNDVLIKDSLRRMELLKTAEVKSVKTDDGKTLQTKSIAFAPGGQYYTNLLNEAAWFIYKNSTSKNYLKKALEWVNKGNEYSERFEAMDTEARLLYKLGEREAAIKLLEKAIRQKNERVKISSAFSYLYKVLENMKDGKEVIDEN